MPDEKKAVAAVTAQEFLHFVCELRPRQAPGSRRVTEERLGKINRPTLAAPLSD